jgi:hypothetical protein
MFDDIFNHLKGEKLFLKFDLSSGYNEIRVEEPNISKKDFKNIYGNYDFLVFHFGLTNSPTFFM